jgi:group I intron endonuclease
MTFYLYKIANIKNNKVYIGKTVDFVRRWNSHKNLAASDARHFYIHNAINKYGIDNFIFEIISEHIDENEAYEEEVLLIAKYKSNNAKFGYNLTIGGKGVLTDKPVSLETRKKISEAQIGIKRRKSFEVTEFTRQKLSATIKYRGNLSVEKKKEILELFDSGNYTKKQLAEMFNIRFETVRNVIIYYKKNGFKSNEEKRKNRSKAKIGRTLSKETKNKISEALKGTVFTEERKNNISNSLIGKVPSTETREKIAASISGKNNYLEIKKNIIELFETGNYSKIELAKKFELNRKTVEKIIKRHNDGNI